MTTRTITTILAALLALLIVAPAGATVGIGDPTWRQAAEPEYSISAFANPLTQEIWLAGRLPMDTPRDARNLVALTDADDIARNLDMTVLASDTSTDLAPLGIGPVSMYAGFMDGGDAMVLLTSHDADVWLFLFSVPDLGDMDTDAAALWSVETMLAGAAMSPGAGFVAVDDDVIAWEGQRA